MRQLKQPDNGVKKFIINNIPVRLLKWRILSVIPSCIVFTIGFYYSLNDVYNPFYSYDPPDQVAYSVKLFLLWLPILLSLVVDTLIAMTFVSINSVREKYQSFIIYLIL
ncbi:MAG: hypothetical protein ACYDEF_13745 [Methanosarcina sp.]